MINTSTNEYNKETPMASELRAVLHIFSYDRELREKALPYVDVEKEVINWFGIGRNHFSSGHSAAIMWARSIWMAKSPINDDPFERTFSMDPPMRKTLLEALAIAWGVV
jgi:hypothetical protein